MFNVLVVDVVWVYFNTDFFIETTTILRSVGGTTFVGEVAPNPECDTQTTGARSVFSSESGRPSPRKLGSLTLRCSCVALNKHH